MPMAFKKIVAFGLLMLQALLVFSPTRNAIVLSAEAFCFQEARVFAKIHHSSAATGENRFEKRLWSSSDFQGFEQSSPLSNASTMDGCISSKDVTSRITDVRIQQRTTISAATIQTATLLVASSLFVTAPMPAASAMEEATMLPNHPPVVVTSPSSSLVMAAAQSTPPSPSAPYTGQLLDTASANVVRLDSGVTYNDLREGNGAEVATPGKRVNIQWSLKRSNGYSIDSSAQNDGIPFIFVVGASPSTPGAARAIPGLDEGIRGMRVGGIRRIVIPPSLAYVDGLEADSPGPVPPGFGPKQRIKRVMENRMDVPDESFLLDVKLTRVQ